MLISDWSSDVCSSDLRRVSPATVAPLSANAYKPVRHKGDQCNDAQAEGQMPMRGPVAKQGLRLKCLLPQRPAGRAQHAAPQTTDRKSVVTGKSVPVRVDLGVCSIIQQKKNQNT